ncbi:TRAP transporter substrate-binding protein [Anaerotruncus rubiinfantis]|uniref:TRAP transporter substrate-binding protein n=1 Tax=Anaerotruncus rubiinfantis TaxID=1720200 RepID=UPI0034A0DB8A
MNSKKILAVLLSMTMLVGSLAACGGSESASSAAPAPAASAGDAAPAQSDPAPADAVTFTVTADVTGARAPYVDRFAELIAEKTEGRYKADVIAAASLGNASDMAQMLQMGTLDVLMSDDMSMDGVLDGALGFAWLPGLVKDYEEADKYYNNGWIADKLAEIMEQNNLIRISSYCNGFRQVGNIKRPITEMNDLKGLKIRTPSVESIVSFYEKCGALPVMIAGSEVLSALQTGTVDGLDNAVFNYVNQGITDVITQICTINYCYSGGCFIAGPDFWNKLSDEDKEIFRECAQIASDEFTEYFRAETENIQNKGVESGQWEITEPSAEMQAELEKIYQEIWDESYDKYGADIMDPIISGEYKTLS